MGTGPGYQALLVTQPCRGNREEGPAQGTFSLVCVFRAGGASKPARERRLLELSISVQWGTRPVESGRYHLLAPGEATSRPSWVRLVKSHSPVAGLSLCSVEGGAGRACGASARAGV